jgi:hypothetical protein
VARSTPEMGVWPIPRAQELDVSTLGERGDRGGPYRLQKGAEEG